VSRWNEADLEARLCRALDVALKTVTAFGVDGYTDADPPMSGFGREKPLAETAMLMYASASCHSRIAVGARVDALAAALLPLVRSERVMLDIALNPALAYKFAAPHVLLTKLGFPDDAFDAFLDASLASEAADGQDRPPSARLERLWLSSLRRSGQHSSDWSSTLAGSLLGTPLDILSGRRDDSYAWTHLLMYATDFGNEPGRAPQSPDGSAQAAALLARYLDMEDYDLAGEVLLSWPLTAAAWSPSGAFGFKVIASVEDQGTAYRTAYVMGFLCATSLKTGRTPPEAIPAAHYETAALDSFLPFIDESRGHWQAEFARLASEEQRALTPFVLDVGIVQASRRRDYAGLLELLSRAQAHGFSDAPLCRQATELLNRIARCGAATSSPVHAA
jgi:hypothetical protein